VSDDAAEDTKSAASSASRLDPEVVIFVGLALLAGALWFDWSAAKDVAAQVRASSYAVTEGVVTSSRVVVEPDSHDPPPAVSVGVTYAYAVADRAFTGDHYYADDHWGASSGSWAADIVRALPVGTRVPVYYALDEPAHAVLRPGITGGQLLMGVLAVLLNLVPLSLIVGAWRRKRGVPDPMESAVAKREMEIPTPVAPFRALFTALTPFGAAVTALGLSSTLVLFLFVPIFGSHPSLELAGAAWAVIAGATVSAYIYSARRRSSSASGGHPRKTMPSSV
jgi:hypothetical protein